MRLIALYIIIAALFTVSHTSCSDTPRELKTVEQIMEDHPDSALHILQKLPPEKYNSYANRALYGILFFQALDKNYMPMQPDSLLDFSIDYYTRQDDKIRLGRCYLYKGRRYLDKNKYEQATSEYLKALDNLKNETDYNILGEVYSDMGKICSLQQQHKEAREKYQLATRYFLKAHKRSAVYYSMLDIGVTYRWTKEFKTALKYCHKVISQTNDSILLGVAYQEIGNIYMISNQPDSAIHFLRKSLQYPAKGTDYAVRNYSLADAYIDKNQNDSAEVYTKESLKYPASFFTRRGCYRILVNTTYLKGNIKLMGKYMSKYQDYTDSVRTIESQTKASVIEDLHTNSAETSSAKHSLIITILLLVVVTLLGGIISYYFYKRNKIRKQELEGYKTELNSKQIFVSQSISKKIEDSKAIHAVIRKNALPNDRIKLDKEVYNNSLHINDWKIFTYEMNHAFNNIVDKIHANHPILTSKEISWCCLHLLNIPTADRVFLLETTTEGLYKMKQRIAQKLDLKSGKDLDAFLKDIVSK
jgi:tetratricopeptide (TPR) repeat protein